ncbi:integral membrane protein [Sporormia fimetaria CBS 119925]|uniref:Integral membrane protein n=1 Tax=Sporormia fimetaria CBS 119925 TaxID=1340428 RepID=A0A6A6UXX9_9PLEO|nr:integral membrane protein [Sporormia fimetaria CBS 119925]
MPHRSKRSTQDVGTISPIERPSNPSKDEIKRTTRRRKIFALLTSLFLLTTTLFLVLVELGSTYPRPVLKDWYFIRLDVSHVLPRRIPNAELMNTIAQSIGLHDFYQVGLWGYCSGYFDSRSVTFCSRPQTLYWFNPVEILQNDLIAGASITLPADIANILNLVRIISRVMFAFFLTSAVFSAFLIILAPLSLYTRWLSILLAMLTFINALLCTTATIIATALFVIIKRTVESVDEANISAELGAALFAFMWLATLFSIAAWLIQTGLCCCYTSRREARKRKKRGSSEMTQRAQAPV